MAIVWRELISLGVVTSTGAGRDILVAKFLIGENIERDTFFSDLRGGGPEKEMEKGRGEAFQGICYRGLLFFYSEDL